MYIIDGQLQDEGDATPATLLRARLGQAYAAHKHAEHVGVTLSDPYCEWLNYLIGRSLWGIGRPVQLPESMLIDYLRWFVATEEMGRVRTVG